MVSPCFPFSNRKRCSNLFNARCHCRGHDLWACRCHMRLPGVRWPKLWPRDALKQFPSSLGWEWVQWVQGAQMKKKTHQYVRYWSIYINIDHLESRVEMLTGPQQQDYLVATIFWTKPTHPVMVSLVLDRTFAWWLWPYHVWQGRQTVHDWVRWRMTNHWTLLSLLKHIKAMSNNMKMFIVFISLDRKKMSTPYRSR